MRTKGIFAAILAVLLYACAPVRAGEESNWEKFKEGARQAGEAAWEGTKNVARKTGDAIAEGAEKTGDYVERKYGEVNEYIDEKREERRMEEAAPPPPPTPEESADRL